MNSNAPRPLESDPPSAGDGIARAPRVSRHKLRLPNDLTSMDAPDDTFSPDDAAVTDRALGPSPTIPSAPPDPDDAVAIDLHMPLIPPPSAVPSEVEVTLDTANAVSLPPPPVPALVMPEHAHPVSSGSMRVVRRRVRVIGAEEPAVSLTPAPPIGSPQPSAPSAAVGVAPLAKLPDLGFDLSGDSAPETSLDPDSTPTVPRLDDLVPVEALTTPAPRVVTPPPLPAATRSEPAVRFDEAVPKRPSTPPPSKRPSTPPPSLVTGPATPAVAPPATPASMPPLPVAAAPSVALPVAPALPASPPPVPPTARPSTPPPRIDAPKPLAAPVDESADDESVEISLDEHADSHVTIPSSLPPRGIDPSLALLDELAELGHATPVESVDPDAIEHVETGAARGASMPPPPPPLNKGASSAVKVSGGPTMPDLKAKRRRAWWEELFNEDYFRTVERLTPEQVQTEADWIENALGVEAGASILDVGCGAGRQAIELSRRRYDVTAVDLSMAMLTRASEAAQEAGARVAFTQCDMVAMDFHERFDAAYCVGSSFGFFDDPRNAEVARRVHHALKPHGTLLLAVLNRDHVIQHQPAMSWFEGDGCVCMEESSFNFITSRINVKRTMIYDDGRQREFEYSIRLYSLHELGQVLHEAGFRILEVSGHTRTPGAFFGPSSRELIILAQKRAPEVVDLGSGDGALESTRPQ
jgi:SAM-dependent methyltransferase